MTQSINDFKIKHNGQKLRVRVMNADETIKPNSLQHYMGENQYGIQAFMNSESVIENLQRLEWLPSKCVGEKIKGTHESRIYIEVLSSFFVPLSTSEYAEID